VGKRSGNVTTLHQPAGIVDKKPFGQKNRVPLDRRIDYGTWCIVSVLFRKLRACRCEGEGEVGAEGGGCRWFFPDSVAQEGVRLTLDL
jgi:hypothetical protein